jgi:hypothetical protein
MHRNGSLDFRPARRLFLASNGYIGLAPPSAALADEICLLFGGDVPYVVRTDNECSRFIGECYCYGIMNGEAMQDVTNEKNKLYVLT